MIKTAASTKPTTTVKLGLEQLRQVRGGATTYLAKEPGKLEFPNLK